MQAEGGEGLVVIKWVADGGSGPIWPLLLLESTPQIWHKLFTKCFGSTPTASDKSASVGHRHFFVA
jgi:hypothetical protein